MSVATVITQGYGSFGDIAHVVRDGYDGNLIEPPAPPPVVTAVRGGKGDNKPRYQPVKPLGLPFKRKEQKAVVTEGIDETLKFQAEVAGELARQLREELEELVELPPVAQMSLSEIDAEIGALLKKKIRSEDDEILLLLLIAASA